MKKETDKYILSLFGIIAMNILYFIWEPYPKGILSPVTENNTASDIVTNCIFYFMFFFCLIIISKSIGNYFFEVSSAFNGFSFLILLMMFGVQLAFDIIRILGNKYLTDYYQIISDVCTVLTWCVVWMILIHFSGNTIKIKEKSTKHTLIITAILLATATAIVIILDCNDIAAFKNLSGKYLFTKDMLDLNSNSSNILKSIITTKMNINFVYQFRNAVFDTVIGGILITTFYVLKQRDNAFSQVVEDTSEFHIKPAITLIVRIILVFVSAFLICILKAFIAPHSVFSGSYSSGCNSVDYTGTKTFDTDYKTTYITRIGDNELKNIYYCATDIYICYGNEQIFSFRINGEPLYDNETKYYGYDINEEVQVNENPLYIEDNYFGYDVDGITVHSYYNIVVAYLKDGKPFVIMIKDIKKQPEDKTLLQFCEDMISNANWNYLEFTYKYIQKYDNDFIQPYLERYSREEFTDAELTAFSDINKEYIKDFALQVLSEH